MPTSTRIWDIAVRSHWAARPSAFYVEDVDRVVERSLKAGAKLERAVADQFYGDRNGIIHDPFGHVWTIATHKKDIPPEEMERRATAAMAHAQS